MATPRWAQRPLIALALGVAIGLSGLLTNTTQSTLEYSGSCGQFRWCRTSRWGLSRSCTNTNTDRQDEPPLRMFAPESSCAADWILLYRDVHGFAFAGTGPVSPLRGVVQRLRHFYSLQVRAAATGAFETDLDRLRAELEQPPYKLGACGEFKTRFGRNHFTIALVGKDSDDRLHCWVLTNSGELRHLRLDDQATELDWSDDDNVREVLKADFTDYCRKRSEAMNAAYESGLIRLPDGGVPRRLNESACSVNTDELYRRLQLKDWICSRLYGTQDEGVDSVTYILPPEIMPAYERSVRGAELDGGVFAFEGSRARYVAPGAPAPPGL